MGATVLELRAELDRPRIPVVTTETSLKLKVQLSPAPDRPVTNTHVGIVVDCPVLTEESLRISTAAARNIVHARPDGDVVSLFAVQRWRGTLAKNLSLNSAARDALVRKLDRVKAGGRPNLADGLGQCGRALDRSDPGRRVWIAFTENPRAVLDAARQAGAVSFVVFTGTDKPESVPADPLHRVVHTVDPEAIAAAFDTFMAEVDMLVATAARLVISVADAVRVGLGYRTQPERAYLGPLSADENGDIELPVGAVGPDDRHAFMILLRAPPSEERERGIARVELKYDAPAGGMYALSEHADIRLQYGEAAPETISESQESHEDQRPAIAQLSEKLLDANRQNNRRRTADLLQELVEISSAHPTLATQFRTMQETLESGDKLTAQMLESTALVRSNVNESDRWFYEVVLVDPGDQPILVVRELREATGLALAEVSEMLKRPTTIGRGLGFAQASALKRRIRKTGATVEMKRRSPEGESE